MAALDIQREINLKNSNKTSAQELVDFDPATMNSISAFSEKAFSYLLGDSSQKVTLNSVKQIVHSRISLAYQRTSPNGDIKIEDGILFELFGRPAEPMNHYVVSGITSLFGLDPNAMSSRLITVQLLKMLLDHCPRKIKDWEGLGITTFELLSAPKTERLATGETFYTFETSSGELVFMGDDAATGLIHILKSERQSFLNYQGAQVDEFLGPFPLLLPIESSVQMKLTAVNPNKWSILNNQITLSGYLSAKNKAMDKLKEIDYRILLPSEIFFHKINTLEAGKHYG